MPCNAPDVPEGSLPANDATNFELHSQNCSLWGHHALRGKTTAGVNDQDDDTGMDETMLMGKARPHW